MDRTDSSIKKKPQRPCKNREPHFGHDWRQRAAFSEEEPHWWCPGVKGDVQMVPAEVKGLGILAVDAEKLNIMLQKVVDHLTVATRRYGPMASPHEGIAVIEEEYDELLKEVRDNKRLPGEYLPAMEEEAIHLTSMGLRFLLDVC